MRQIRHLRDYWQTQFLFRARTNFGSLPGLFHQRRIMLWRGARWCCVETGDFQGVAARVAGTTGSDRFRYQRKTNPFSSNVRSPRGVGIPEYLYAGSTRPERANPCHHRNSATLFWAAHHCMPRPLKRPQLLYRIANLRLYSLIRPLRRVVCL